MENHKRTMSKENLWVALVAPLGPALAIIIHVCDQENLAGRGSFNLFSLVWAHCSALILQ